jgi:two-component system LytT family response regulator
MSMKTIIIEDNSVDLENLCILLEGEERCELVGTAATIEDGVALARRERPDLILTDIQLGPEISLEHLGDLGCNPAIICTTLYDSHALQAYDVGAVDYLMKPVTAQKLERALNRIGSDSVRSENPQQSVLLKTGNATQVLSIDQIFLVSSERDYSAVFDQSGAFSLCDRRMYEWLELLPEGQFVSLDRSTIVNLKQVSSFSRGSDSRKGIITFSNGRTAEVGATAFRRLQTFFKK